MTDFKDAASADEIEPGQGAVVEVDGREIALFNVSGAFYALENTCCHRGGPLGEGQLDGSIVTCPWHMWQFDVKSGECQNSPGDRVRAYDVIVEDGRVRVKI
jgi:nitrite reductase (NADH) small subunit